MADFHVDVSAVAVAHGNKFDHMSGTGEFQSGSAETDIRIIGMRPDHQVTSDLLHSV